MNGSWAGIQSRYGSDRMAQKVTDAFQDGGEPSMDVINTIIASYAASTCGESEAGCAADNSTPNPILARNKIDHFCHKDCLFHNYQEKLRIC